MNRKQFVHVATATSLCVIFALAGLHGRPAGAADHNPVIIEFVCEIDDDISQSWVGLDSVILVKGGSNMWEITSNTGDITHYVQKAGERCQTIVYEVESVDTSSVRA